MQRGIGFGDGSEAGEVEGGVGSVVDRYEGLRGEGHGRQKVMMWRRGCGGGAEGAHVDDGPLEEAL